MAAFRYRAISPDGKEVRGVVERGSVGDVAVALAQQGLTPTRIDPVNDSERGGDKAVSGFRLPAIASGMGGRIAEFTRELAIMLSSSVPLDRSLSVLQNLAIDPRLKEIIGAVLADIKKGSSLADAFEKHREFSVFYVSLVRAGEASGALEMTMTRLANHLERSRALRHTVVSALIYPAILLTVSVLSLILLLGFVVPKFADMFTDMGATLPLPTRVVLGLGDWVGSYWWVLIALIVAALWGASRLLQNAETRERIDLWMLGLPIVGDLIGKIETARLANALGTLLKGGVTIVSALKIAVATVGNRVLSREIDRGAASLKEGKMLSSVLMEEGHFPPLAMHMIQVGEETGQLEDMLVKVADIYDEEVNSAVKRFLALIEPVLILGLGVLIAGIILSIMVGIMSINELVY